MAAVRFEPKGMDCPLKTKEAIEKGAAFGHSADFLKEGTDSNLTTQG